LSSGHSRQGEALAADRELAATLKTSKVPSIARAAAVLRVLGQSTTPLGVQSIARQLGIVTSSAFYVLRALVAEELVAFDPDTKRYSLGPGVLTLAQYWFRRDRFAEMAQPHLDRIAQAFNTTVVGTHLFGLEPMIIVAVSQSASNFQLSTHIGTRFPALTSATGRCIAAFGGYPEAELEARFHDAPWDIPVPFHAWRKQVERARLRGFAVDQGSYVTGMTSVAAPVWTQPGKLTHAINAFGVTSALERRGMADLEDAILAAAQALSHRA
jgi:DNA-binding IclR family transcriptional regulator